MDDYSDDEGRGRRQGGRNRDKEPDYASPRDDAVTRKMSTTGGKLQLMSSSAVVGGCIGAFVAKSLLHVNDIFPWFTTCFVLSLLSAWLLRNPYGELVRAMGLAIILVLQRTTAIRKQYPTWSYVPSFFHLKPRMSPPFPPSSRAAGQIGTSPASRNTAPERARHRVGGRLGS